MIEFRISLSGNLSWYKVLNRTLYISVSRELTWYYDILSHNNNGPAYRWTDGDESWYVNDQLHRLDGPASKDILYKTNIWCINGIRYGTELEYWIAVQNYDKA